MSFKCDDCGNLSKEHKRFVSETRKKEYVNQRGKVSRGYETVKELNLCPQCLEKREGGKSGSQKDK